MSIKILGYNNLEKFLNMNKNPEKYFDKTIQKNARQSLSILVRTTNVDEGHTHRAWQLPRKIKNSLYMVSNNIKTEDKKHYIVNILNDGRGPIYPKKSNKYGLLYIPIGPSRIGRKKLGARIPKNAQFGKHYIFAKKTKAFKGTQFINKEIKNRYVLMKKDILKKIERFF